MNRKHRKKPRGSTVSTPTEAKSPVSPRRAVYASVDTGNSFSTELRWRAARVERISHAINTFDREKLSSFARYEYLFNQRCAGLVHSITLGLVGCGPRPQVRTSDTDFNRDLGRVHPKNYRNHALQPIISA